LRGVLSRRIQRRGEATLPRHMQRRGKRPTGHRGRTAAPPHVARQHCFAAPCGSTWPKGSDLQIIFWGCYFKNIFNKTVKIKKISSVTSQQSVVHACWILYQSSNNKCPPNDDRKSSQNSTVHAYILPVRHHWKKSIYMCQHTLC
jgi:hypothetical protein